MIDRYFELYIITDSFIGKLLRIFLLVFILGLVVLTLTYGLDLSVVLAIFGFLIIFELFFEHLTKIRPAKKVQETTYNSKAALTFDAKRAFNSSDNTFNIASRLDHRREVSFFKKKLNMGKIEEANVTKEELLKQARELVLWIKGDYITSIDLYASYVLLSEETTRFMQKNVLTNDDIINVLYWTRQKFSPDKFDKQSIKLIGSGVFDELCYGWNFELKKYSIDLTQKVLSNYFPPNVLGEEKKFDELIVALSKKKSSNVIIIGNNGVGKTSLIEYFAYQSFLGKLPEDLNHKKVYELFTDKLIAGVNNSGELEQRLGALLAEISFSGNVIVFVKNIENIFGGGTGLDVSGVLADYLDSTRIKIIGTTTPSAYADYIENREGILDLVEKVELDEPDGGKVMLILTEKAGEFEAKYGLNIYYSALKQSVILSPLYYPDKYFPGKAISLLEDVAAKANLEKVRSIDGSYVNQFVEEKTKVVNAEPDKKEKELLLGLEGKLHERVVGQEDAIKAVAETMRRLRSGFKNENRPISSFLFLGPTGVGKTETAKALALEYFGSEDAMIRLDMSEYQTQDQIDRLLGEKPGQEYIPNTLTDLITEKPFSLVLLDEFEKANRHLVELFLQVLDEGRLTDNRGKTVSFTNTIIIATSNAGSEMIREKGMDVNLPTEKQEIIDKLLRDSIFTPELLNRFDDIVLFRVLNHEEVKQVSELLLSETKQKMEERGIKVEFDDKVVEKISKESYDSSFGARNIRRYITDNIEGFLSEQILKDLIKKGDRTTLSVDGEGKFIVL